MKRIIYPDFNKILDQYIKEHYLDDNDFSIDVRCSAPTIKRFETNIEYDVCCKSESIDDFIDEIKLDKFFSESVLELIDENGLDDVSVYKKAGLDRKLFSKLRSDKNYRPSKKTAVALCIALELDLDETNELLKKAGYSLSNSYMFDVIIECFIKHGVYDLDLINNALLERDEMLLY